jgi:hypothetical protein
VDAELLATSSRHVICDHPRHLHTRCLKGTITSPRVPDK